MRRVDACGSFDAKGINGLLRPHARRKSKQDQAKERRFFFSFSLSLSLSLSPPLFSFTPPQLGSILINLGTVRRPFLSFVEESPRKGGKKLHLSFLALSFSDAHAFPPSLSFSSLLSSLAPLLPPPKKQQRQNLMKLGHNKSLALEEFARNNAPPSPSPTSSVAAAAAPSLSNFDKKKKKGSSPSSSKKHQRLQRPKPRPARSFREWQSGIALFAGGNVLNFVSFGFAAQSLLAALGSVQFVSNVVFARLVLKEAVTWRVLCATALIVTGEEQFFLLIYERASERERERERERKRPKEEERKISKNEPK